MTTVPATNTQPRKFMFDRSFDDGSLVAPTRKAPPVSYTHDQIEAIKKEQFDTGFSAGRKSAMDEHAQGLNIIIEKINATFGQLLEHAESARQKQEVRVREAVLAIARKIMPDFCQKNGLQEIETVLSKTLSDMANEPRLVVRVNEAQFDAVDAALKATTEKQGYSGKIVLLADAETRANDCRIEWADGGVERNVQALWQNFGKTLAPDQAQPPTSTEAAS